MKYTDDIGNQSSQFNIDNSSTTYTLADGDAIASSNHGIYEASNWHLNTIRVDGSITATQSGKDAIYSLGSETRITIGETGVLNGYGGILAGGDYARITNNGSITGLTNSAVYLSFSDHSRFTNNGSITGEVVVDRSDDVNIVLGKNSIVENLSGSTMDIASNAGQDAHIVNNGEITASSWGVYMRNGNETFINRGTISGGISMGDGNDVFDNRGGTVDSQIYGDGGNDTFIIDSKIDIYEYSGDGTDTVKSTISLNLSSSPYTGWELENLILLGNANHNAIGNALANKIAGNSGDNILSGLAGDDILTGGKGGDTFVFKTGGADDTVTDFQNGQDHFNLKSWAAITGFADLKAHHVSVSGSDLVIHAGTDSITLLDTSKSELDAGDFVF